MCRRTGFGRGIDASLGHGHLSAVGGPNRRPMQKAHAVGKARRPNDRIPLGSVEPHRQRLPYEMVIVNRKHALTLRNQPDEPSGFWQRQHKTNACGDGSMTRECTACSDHPVIDAYVSHSHHGDSRGYATLSSFGMTLEKQ